MKTKKICLNGKIDIGDVNGFDTVFLTDRDGWKIDLVDKFIEIGNNGVNKLQVNYFISDDPKDNITFKEDFIFKISGGLTAEKESTTSSGSSWTGSWTVHDTSLSIGGHNLYRELSSHVGKYILLEINITY